MQRRLDKGRELDELLSRLRQHLDHVRTFFKIGIGTVDGIFKVGRVRSCDDDHVLVNPGIHSGVDLADHLLLGDDFRLLDERAVRRLLLILQKQAGDSGSLIFLHCTVYIECVAVTALAVGQDRDIHRIADVLDHIDFFRKRQQAGIGLSQNDAVQAVARGSRGLKSGFFNSSCRKRVIRAGSNDVIPLFDQLTDTFSKMMHTIHLPRNKYYTCIISLIYFLSSGKLPFLNYN